MKLSDFLEIKYAGLPLAVWLLLVTCLLLFAVIARQRRFKVVYKGRDRQMTIESDNSTRATREDKRASKPKT
jgi:hypothetical protein